MVSWKVGDSVDYEVCSAASEIPRRRCAENSTTRLHDGVEVTRCRCPAGERYLVPRLRRAQRLEEAVLQVRGVEVQELRGAHRQGEPRRPRAAPRRLGQRAPGIRKKEEAGPQACEVPGEEEDRACAAPTSVAAILLSLAQVAKPAARKPAAKPAAKKPAKKSCEPASTAAPSPRRHANPRRRPAKKKPAVKKSPAKKKSPARKKKK